MLFNLWIWVSIWLSSLKHPADTTNSYVVCFLKRDWVVDGRYNTFVVTQRDHRLPIDGIGDVEVYEGDIDSYDIVSIDTEICKDTSDVMIKTVGNPFDGKIIISI